MLNRLILSTLTIISRFTDNPPRLVKKINKLAINASIDVCRCRPHPWSMVHDYVSWESLTEKQWSARHLPAKILNPPKEDIAEELFRRKEIKYCPRSTCLFPAFAQYLTDGFIRTRMPQKGESDELRKQNTSNHEIDLSTLYGRTVEQTRALRLLNNDKGRKGRLKSQRLGDEEFAPFLYDEDLKIKPEFGTLDLPVMSEAFQNNREILSKIFAFGGDRTNASPQVAMINTLFLREHNRSAGIIEEANPRWDDEHVFQVARNIMIVLFLKIIIEEYINHISPAVDFKADPEVAWDAPWNKPNWITTEFSLLYRWHSLIPDELKWGQVRYPIAKTIMNNGPLADVGLKQAFIDMSAQRAGRVGAFNTAESLLHLEDSAIKQGRLCRLASYADYREHVSLSRPQDFSDISSDGAVVALLQRIYHKVDDVEFYVGIFAEDPTPPPLPPLIRRMVAVDAFSQALTNPLLSKYVFNEDTFTREGMDMITNTSSLRDILQRNVADQLKPTDFVGMTRPD